MAGQESDLVSPWPKDDPQQQGFIVSGKKYDWHKDLYSISSLISHYWIWQLSKAVTVM